MVNHISRQSPEFRDFERHGRASRRRTCSSRSTRSGRTASRRRADVALIFLRKPEAPFSTITIADDRRARRRSGPPSGPPTGPSRSTSTSVAGHAVAHRGLARLPRVAGRPDRPPRRRRLRHQEAGHDAASWSSPRSTSSSLAHRRRRVAWASSCCPRSTTSTRRTSGSPRMASGPTTSCCPVSSSTRSRRAMRRRLAEHLADRPTRQFTTLDCHDGIPVRPGPRRHPRPGGDARPRRRSSTARAATSTGSCPTRMRRRRRPPAQLHLLLGAGGDDDATWRRARSSCSRGGCRRSTTPGSSRARTTSRRSSGSARAGRSTGTTTGRRDPRSARPPGRAAAPPAHPAPQHPSCVRRRDVRRGEGRRNLADAVAIPERRAVARRRLRRRTSGCGRRCGTNAGRQLATLTDRAAEIAPSDSGFSSKAACCREAGRSEGFAGSVGGDPLPVKVHVGPPGDLCVRSSVPGSSK